MSEIRLILYRNSILFILSYFSWNGLTSSLKFGIYYYMGGEAEDIFSYMNRPTEIHYFDLKSNSSF